MNIILPNSRGFVASRTSSDTEATLIPVASLRYKNLFITASHYLDTNFDFPENTTVATIQDPMVEDSFVVTDILRTSKLSAGRLEWDASLGYFLHPYVAVTAGYKFIEQDYTETVTTTFRFVSVIDGSSQDQSRNDIIKVRQRFQDRLWVSPPLCPSEVDLGYMEILPMGSWKQSSKPRASRIAMSNPCPIS